MSFCCCCSTSSNKINDASQTINKHASQTDKQKDSEQGHGLKFDDLKNPQFKPPPPNYTTKPPPKKKLGGGVYVALSPDRISGRNF